MIKKIEVEENYIKSLQLKADYYDKYIDKKLNTNFRDTATILGIKEKLFIDNLLKYEFIYRSKSGKIKPYASKNNGLFEIKEYVNENNGYTGTQTLITPKGKEKFRELMEKEVANGI